MTYRELAEYILNNMSHNQQTSDITIVEGGEGFAAKLNFVPYDEDDYGLESGHPYFEIK